MEGCTIGLDVSDEYTYAAVLDGNGKLVEETRMRTQEASVRQWLSKWQPSVVALETGTHARWIERVGGECGHEMVVADARHLRLIYGGTNKTDRVDAVKLARLARADRALMYEVKHRDEEEHADLAVIAAREMLVQMRTAAINMVRGMVKSAGKRVGACSSTQFTTRATAVVPDYLRNALAPILEQIDEFSERIREYDERIEHLAQTKYPETAVLKQIAGIGALSALTFRLTIGKGDRFQQSRDVGSYVGLRPKRDQSGERDPRLGITKTGNERLRKTLVHSAHYILGPFGPDTDLRRWGLKLAAGGRNAKKRAIVAVARKLAVLMHRLLVDQKDYEPLRQQRRQAEVAA
jgi:transposase